MGSLVYGNFEYMETVDNLDIYTNSVLALYVNPDTPLIAVSTLPIYINDNIIIVFKGASVLNVGVIHIQFYVNPETIQKKKNNLEDGFELQIKFNNGSIRNYSIIEGKTKEERNNGRLNFKGTILIQDMDFPLIESIQIKDHFNTTIEIIDIEKAKKVSDSYKAFIKYLNKN